MESSEVAKGRTTRALLPLPSTKLADLLGLLYNTPIEFYSEAEINTLLRDSSTSKAPVET